MARLYRVTHPRSRGSLVMKVPKLGPGSPLSATAAFENERQILTRLHGPHVPRLVAVGDPQRRPYLVMEYIEGDTLARASARAPLPVEQVRDLGARLCRAVHDLHRQSVIHLDLNPGNVRDRANGEMVLVDFGVAHHAALPDYLDSAFGEEEGTTPYIAPEQVRHVRTEPRSDLYAIGAILYYLATGQYPHGRPNLLSLKKRLFEPAPPPRLVNPEIPPWLQEIILRCLAIPARAALPHRTPGGLSAGAPGGGAYHRTRPPPARRHADAHAPVAAIALRSLRGHGAAPPAGTPYAPRARAGGARSRAVRDAIALRVTRRRAQVPRAASRMRISPFCRCSGATRPGVDGMKQRRRTRLRSCVWRRCAIGHNRCA